MNICLKSCLLRSFTFKKLKFISNKKFVISKYNFSTLIIPDINNGKLNKNNYQILLSAAEKLSSPIKLLLYGSNISEELTSSASYDVDEIFTIEDKKFENPTTELLSEVIKTLQEKHKFKSIIASSNNFGKNIIPRVAGMLKNTEPLSEISNIINEKTYQRYMYAGNALSTIESNQDLNIMTIRLTSFDKKVLQNENKDVKKTSIDIDNMSDYIDKINSSVFVENIISESDKPDLGSARVVISGGRALKSAENFKMLDELAKCFKGAAIGASRAAVDAGYVGNDLQVGQTGKTVAPELYIAIGISGAIQHIAGMKDSKCIVAINSDGECPIFNVNTNIFNISNLLIINFIYSRLLIMV